MSGTIFCFADLSHTSPLAASLPGGESREAVGASSSRADFPPTTLPLRFLRVHYSTTQ